jgi:predicted HicB family RNase H-like nuclease
MSKKVSGEEADYLYTVGWHKEDGVFVGRVAEFPSLAAHGSTPEAALKEIMSVVRSVIEDLRESGEEVPAAFAHRHYSGRLNLRMPTSRHRQLSIEAAQQGVSLNQLINLKLEG